MTLGGKIMVFFDEAHKNEIEKINRLWSNLRELSEFAKEKGIDDIFQDNGAKILQQLVYLKFKNLPGREGNDAVDERNCEWEMKSINIGTSASGFSTNHHLNHEILAKYREVPWSFAIYNGIELEEIYVMSPEQLEPMFQHWEQKLTTMAHINNPKIPIKFVRQNGACVYPMNEENPVNPADAV